MASGTKVTFWHALVSSTKIGISFLSVFFASVSIISLIQRWSGVSIFLEIARDMLDIYRDFVTVIRVLLFDSWMPIEFFSIKFQVGDTAMDLIMAWLLLGTIGARGLSAFVDLDRKYEGGSLALRYSRLQVYTIFVLGPFAVFHLFRKLRLYNRDRAPRAIASHILPEHQAKNIDNYREKYYQARKLIRSSIAFAFSPLIAVVIFFISNAIFIS